MGPSLALHFPPPPPPSHPQPIMTKVFTLRSPQQAQHQLTLLSSLQAQQQQFQCKIVCMHQENISQDSLHKVVVAFQYPTRSLRQEMIQRRKKTQFPQYFTAMELENILKLAAKFIKTNHKDLCNHSDIWSNIFLHQNSFKICHPELLPCRCSTNTCKNDTLGQKCIDLVLELLLLEKVVRGGIRQKQKAQYLYTHSAWINRLLEELLEHRGQNILKICYKYEDADEWDRKPSNRGSYNTHFSELARFTTSFERSPLSLTQMPRQSLTPQIKQFKLPQQTKASNTNRIRYYSDFSQLQPQNHKKQMLLDAYQKQLAQSIDQLQQNSIVLNPSLYDNVNETDRIVNQNIQNLQADSYLLLQPIRTQVQCFQNSQKNNRSYVYNIVPTIEQQQNQIYSQESRKTISHIQSEKEFHVVEQEGYRYQGQLVNGKKHGKGVFKYPNGVYYEGDWVYDQMDGIGSLYYPSGQPYYRGQWKMGSFHGRGVFYNEQPEPIDGSYHFRDFNHIGKKWRIFQGTFKQDKKNGQGLLTLSNGQTFKAQWRDNIVQGRGQFHTLNNQIIKGIWIQNVLYLQQQNRQLL